MSRIGEMLRGMREPAESGEETNVAPFPPRHPDDVTTRPHRHPFDLRFGPPPAADLHAEPPRPEELRDFRKEVTGSPPSTLPPATVREIDAATNILEILLEHEGAARERVVALYETMMELYAPKPPAADAPTPTVEGAPV
jgi:hypothetical protein